MFNTKITALRSFIIEQLLVIKETAKETSSVGSSQSESNRLQDEITYLREECKTKNCVIQTLLENQKVIQNTVNTGSFDKNTKSRTEPFIIPKKFASHIRTSLTKPISTSNSFELLSENSGNVLEANNILSTEIHNAVKDNKTNNANTSNENRKSDTPFPSPSPSPPKK